MTTTPTHGIISETIDALRAAQVPQGRQASLAFTCEPRAAAGAERTASPRMQVIGMPTDLSMEELLKLDRSLALTTELSALPILEQLQAWASRRGGRDGGLSPADIAKRLLDGLPQNLESLLVTHEPPHPRPSQTLVCALRLAQLAVWICEKQAGDPAARELLPRAAEAAFLCASLPLRLLDDDDEPIDERARKIWAHHLTRTGGVELSLENCRRDAVQARTLWLEMVFRMELYPSLMAARPAVTDRRLRALIRRDLAVPERGFIERRIHIFQADEALIFQRPGADSGERQQLLELTAMHLLPRYLSDESIGLLLALRDAQLRAPEAPGRPNRSSDATAPMPASRPRHRAVATRLPRLTWLVASRLLLPVRSLAGLVIIALAIALPLVVALPQAAALPPSAVHGLTSFASATILVLGIAWSVLVVAVVMTGGREGSFLALLRMPATSAFGLAILLTFNTAWLRPPAHTVTALLPLAFLLLAGFYLAIETINQGAEGTTILSRAALLTLVGSGVSLSVTSLVLIGVAPAFFASTESFAALQASPAARLWALVLAASAAFMLGTFLQAIWDEAPVTAPLSRLRLR